MNKHHRPEWYSLSSKERKHNTRIGSSFRKKPRLLWACGFSRYLEPSEEFDGKVANIDTGNTCAFDVQFDVLGLRNLAKENMKYPQLKVLSYFGEEFA